MNLGKYKWELAVLSIFLTGFFVLSRNKKDSKTKNKNPKSILFIGDSQAAIKSAEGKDIKFTYPNFLIEPLKSKGISVDVLAKGGQTTDWMLKNLPAKLKEKKFDRIYIQAGGNDAINMVSYEKYKSNLEKMIALGQEAGADVFFMVWFDRSKTLDPKKVVTTKYVKTKEEMYERYKRYFEWQRKIGKDLEDKANGILPMFEIPKELVPDGIHPNSEGAKISANQILKTL